MTQDKWREPHIVGPLLEDMNKLFASGQSDDPKFFKGGFLTSHIDIWTLSLLYKFPKELPEREQDDIMWAAVSTILKTGPLNAKNLGEEIRRRIKQYFQQPVVEFVLLTTLSLEPRSDLRKTVIGDATMSFSSTRPRGFVEIKSAKHAKTRAKQPGGYTFVRVFVRARTPDDGLRVAYGKLDFFRSIWNFLLSFGRAQMSGQTKAISKIVAGPIATLHLPDGSAASQNYWWNPFYIEPLQPHRIADDDFKKLRANQKWLLTRLKHIKFAERLEQALAEFGKALDDYSHQTGFIRLWSVFEQLTGTGRESHEVTVKRAAAFFRNESAERDEFILDSFRKNRNRIVHAGHDDHDAEAALGRLKMYVERLLIMLIAHGRRFTNWEEVIECMDAPRNGEKVLRRIHHYQWIRKLRASAEAQPESA